MINCKVKSLTRGDPMARQKKPDQRNIDQYNHENQQRVNNPPVGLVTPESDPDGDNKNYSYDPHLDPQLVWAGKAEHTNFEVPTVSLHVHERIDPRSIIEAVRKQNQTQAVQLSLFEIPEENPPIRQAIEFYKHQHNWSNRLVAGDSLLVMNSLLEKEGMAGQVQMIYFDPPYGIKYGSNFQPFVNNRDVKDGKDEDLTQEPEMIKAFRDTWELGIHSYLTYLRDRLLLARELLSESGSVFVQISDENLHHVRELMDEVFGINNFCGQISFKKTGAFSSNLSIPITNMWIDTMGTAEKNKIYVVQTAIKVIQRCLLMTTDPGDLVLDITCLRKGTKILTPSPTLPMNGEGVRELKVPPYTGGFRRGFTGDLGEEKLIPIEEIQPGTLVYSHDQKPHRVLRTIQKQYQGEMIGLTCKNNNTTLWLTADHRVLAKLRPRSLGGNQDWSATPYSHLELRRKLRKEMTPPEQKLWDVLRGKKLEFKFRRQHPIGRYIADFYSRDAHLVVEIDGATHFEPEAIEYDRQRDSFMRSLGLDVLRFTTKEIYENLEGVCLAIESQCRIRTESIEGATWVQAGNLKPGDIVFSALVSPPNPPCTGGVREAVRGGVREAVRGGEIGVEIGVEKISLECVEIAKVENCWSTETVYDLEIEGSHSFITEVCTVHNCGSGTTAYVAEQWGRRWITCDTSRVAITLAKQRLMTATFDYYQLANSQEGVGGGFKYKTVPHITLKSIANNPEIREGMNRIEIEQAINKYADQETLYDQPLLDKSKARITGPFTVEAVPAPTVKPIDDIINPAIPDNSIALLGFDYYNTKTGNIESGSVEKIAVWMLDIDYDGRSIFPRQVFFPMAGEKDAWSRVAKNLKAEIDEDLIESYQGTVSLPFEM
ncbi:site-specific DNA-methyltransferase (adenine-specific) [Planktothrix agardhii NIVA-CYA 126/8]|uniref:Site-specific DNA-methyltransferase (Adenine-specific) n=3 Tax=Planktothrix agardhii TaxID=1160 RepID=A0A073CC45_PLAA1|nr:site-specific DNA-methyltransferase (adenine-specific) [Planktothrix agardhii NIVA-CYA 126/8]